MKKKRSFIETAMRYRGIVFMLCCILVLFGVYGLSANRKNEFPEFTVRQGVVIAVYPGATVKEVEDRVTKPLEDYIFTYGDVKKSKTISMTRDGMVIVQVALEDYVYDKDGFWSRFKHGVSQFKSSLPAGVLAIIVMDDFGDASSMLLAIESKNKTYRELGEYLDGLADNLRPLESVGRITRFGEQKDQISIYLDNDKLSQYGLGYKSVVAFLSGQGLVNIAGTLRDGEYNHPIYVESGVNTLESVRETIVFSAPDGSVVRLKDVARVEREYPDRTAYIEVNGNKCVMLSVEMKKGHDIVKMGKEIKRVLSEFESNLPEEVKMFRITDQTEVVGKSIDDFLREILVAVLAVIIVVVLLQPFKVALIAALTIPISVFISLGLFFGLGYEINGVTLAALVVSLGMIVDNSIVILDDYQERIYGPGSRWRAAEHSAVHFLKSIFSATLAISITFFPFLVTMNGMFSDFVTTFPWSVTIVLTISLLVAIFIVPYLQFAFLKPKTKKKNKFSFESISNFIYERVLRTCFRFPKLTILVAVICVVLGAVMIISRPIKLMPIAERNQFSVEFYLPNGTSINQTSAVADSMKCILEKDPRVTYITTFKGMSSPRFHMTYAPQFAGENFAQFIVNTESAHATEEIIKEYSEKYVDHFANVFVRFKQLSFSDAASPIEIRISDGTDENRKVASEKVKNYLRGLPGVYLVRSSYGEPLSGIKVSLDENASKLGVNQFSVEALLASRYNAGFPIANLWEGNRNVPVVLKGTHADSASFSNLENEQIATYGGLSNAPLRQIAKFSSVFNEGARDRRNGLPTVTISAEVSQNVSANDLALKHFESLKKLTASEGVKLELGGEAASVIETLPGLLKGLVVAVAMMFFIMVWHFRKIRIAFTLFSLLSLSIFGTGVAMWITDMDFTITGVLGMVSLFGIMVRNGIIMIDYAEELKRKEHLSPKNAIYNSALRRMRPIFLTSAAASAGVLPMMVSGDGLWVPMAIIIFWGTLVTMCLILTVLPVAYWGVSCMKFRRRKVISG